MTWCDNFQGGIFEDGIQSDRADDWHRETVRDEAIAAKKKVIADKRRETYWKPENVAKRRAAKAERKRLRAEQAKKNLADAFRIVGEMFRGG